MRRHLRATPTRHLSGLDGSSPDSAIQDLPTLIPEAGVPMALALDAPSSEAGFDAVAQNAPASTPLSPEAKKPQAPTSGAPSSVTAPDETPIPVDVVASRVDLLGTAETASQGSITKEEIDLGQPIASVRCWRRCRVWS